MKIQNNIGPILLDAGKSQAWLADKLKIEKPTVNRWVKNIYQPTKYESKVCKALDVDFEAVFYAVSESGETFALKKN